MSARYPTNLLEMVRAVREKYLLRNPLAPKDFWGLFLCTVAKRGLRRRSGRNLIAQEEVLGLRFQAMVQAIIDPSGCLTSLPAVLSTAVRVGNFPTWASEELYESLGSPAMVWQGGHPESQVLAFVHAARMNLLDRIEADMQAVADTLVILPAVRAEFDRRALTTSRPAWLCHLVCEMFHEANFSHPVTPVAKMFCDTMQGILDEAQAVIGTSWSGAESVIRELSDKAPDQMPSWFDPADRAEGVPSDRLYMSRRNLLAEVEKRLQARLGVKSC